MNAAIDQVEALFGDGPFPHFQRSLGLFRPVGRNIVPRVITSILIGWFPLVVLVVAGSAGGWNQIASFFNDFATHARSLIAVPLFIFCELFCVKKLAAIAHQFVRSGIIRQTDKPAFDALIASNRALMNGKVAEIVAIVAAYAIAFVLVRHLPSLGVRPWYLLDGSSSGMSIAGWWYSFVSLPLLLILVFGWLWRIFLWSRFLIRVAGMKLRLIAAHPDRSSGLKFLNSSLIAFMSLAFTFGVVTAGSVANRVLYQGATIESVQTTVAGLVVFVLILFIGPLLVFVLKLHGQKVEGIFSYGSLADDVGRQFEEKWLANYEKFGSGALEATDFSATTDLYQVVANVHDMRLLPFELRALVSLIVATLLPFIPVLLMTMPLKLIVNELARLLV